MFMDWLLYYYLNLFKILLKKNEKMATTAVTNVTSCESRIGNSTVHARKHELNHNNDSRDRGGNNYHNLWVRIKQMVWGKYNSYLRHIRRYSRYRLSIHSTHSWRCLYFRNNNKSSQSGTVSNRNRKRNRHYLYYSFLISLLTVGCTPAYAGEGETNNTSNPVAAATGNVTNQAVQFQNNGAPSRQHYGPNISCNGSTMTFSPFYMGNHTKPWDIDEDGMRPSSYTMAENWGFQVNFMFPLDQRGLERCRSIAAQQHEKMKLNYEQIGRASCRERV